MFYSSATMNGGLSRLNWLHLRFVLGSAAATQNQPARPSATPPPRGTIRKRRSTAEREGGPGQGAGTLQQERAARL